MAHVFPVLGCSSLHAGIKFKRISNLKTSVINAHQRGEHPGNSSSRDEKTPNTVKQ